MTHRTIGFAKTNQSVYNLFDALRHNLPSHCSVGCLSKGETCANLVIAVDPSLKSQIRVSNLACQPARHALHAAGRFLFWLCRPGQQLIEGSIQQRNSDLR